MNLSTRDFGCSVGNEGRAGPLPGPFGTSLAKEDMRVIKGSSSGGASSDDKGGSGPPSKARRSCCCCSSDHTEGSGGVLLKAAAPNGDVCGSGMVRDDDLEAADGSRGESSPRKLSRLGLGAGGKEGSGGSAFMLSQRLSCRSQTYDGTIVNESRGVFASSGGRESGKSVRASVQDCFATSLCSCGGRGHGVDVESRRSLRANSANGTADLGDSV